MDADKGNGDQICSYSKCQARNSLVTDYKYGQIACCVCGTVQDDRLIDETQEWRNFGSENTSNGGTDANRCGAPSNHFDTTLSTNIMVKNKNNVLAKYSNKYFGNGNTTFLRGTKKLEEIASTMDLHNNVIEMAKENLKKVEESKKLKGRSLNAVIASILHATCKQCNNPKTIKDFIEVLQLDRKDVMRCYSSIKDILKTDNQLSNTQNVIGLVRIFSNKLNLSPKLTETAKEISEKICKIGMIEGRNPATIAASSILHACLITGYDKITKAKISTASQICENTISNAYTKVMEYRNEVLPDSLKYKK